MLFRMEISLCYLKTPLKSESPGKTLFCRIIGQVSVEYYRAATIQPNMMKWNCTYAYNH